MKNKLFLSLLVLFAFAFQDNSNELNAQSKNAFYVEFLGNGLIFSANYDMRLTDGGLGARLGLGYVGGGDGSIITVPVMANYLLGNNGSYFEIGAGITYITGDTSFGDGFDSSIIGTMSFMYRKQPVDGGFMWKIGLTPVIASGNFIPYWPGVGLGYCW